MSAADTFPSTHEQGEIARFGMFDTEVLAEMEQHADDVPVCFANDCGHTADHVLITMCCGDRRLICCECLALAEEAWRKTLGDDITFCKVCGHRFPKRSAFRDVLRVVEL